MTLLDDPFEQPPKQRLQWRQRLVEQHVFRSDSSHHIHVKADYQFEFPPRMVHEIAPLGSDRAKVLLPVTTRDKRPLLRFGCASEGATPHLLRRTSIAGLQAEALGRLVDSGSGDPAIGSGLPDELLEAICVFTPGYYQSLLAGEKRFYRTKRHQRLHALKAFLVSGLSSDPQRARFEPKHKEIEEWLEHADAAGEVLSGYLDEPADPLSSSECVLLALPHVEPRPQTDSEVTKLVRGYRDAIAAAASAKDEELLRRLAEYGRRWEVIVELEVPLLEPFTVSLTEDRPLELSRWRGWRWQPLALREAASVHYEGSLLDPSITVASFSARLPGHRHHRVAPNRREKAAKSAQPPHGGAADPHDTHVSTPSGGTIGLGLLESVRETPEAVAFYSSVEGRPRRIEVGVRLRPARFVQVSTYVALAATAAAIGVAASLRADNQLADNLAVLVLPVTVAAALVLIRAQPLAERRLSRSRAVLGAALVALWVVAVLRIVAAGSLAFVIPIL